MYIEQSNIELLDYYKKHPDFTCMAKVELEGILEGIILYNFLNKKTGQFVYLGDNIKDGQLPIFQRLIKEGIELNHPYSTMEKGVVYHG